jgi:hypothetical protein
LVRGLKRERLFHERYLSHVEHPRENSEFLAPRTVTKVLPFVHAKGSTVSVTVV